MEIQAGLDTGCNRVDVSFFWQTYIHPAAFVLPYPIIPKKKN